MKDFGVDKGGNLDIRNGDIAIVESDEQHVNHILLAEKGQYKQFPALGVGVRKMLNGPFNSAEIKRRVAVNLKADGLKLNTLTFEDGKMNIDYDER